MRAQRKCEAEHVLFRIMALTLQQTAGHTHIKVRAIACVNTATSTVPDGRQQSSALSH